MKDKLRIPFALQIIMDDFGWHDGVNELALSGPARTHIGRKHTIEDIVVINELGKRIGMHILCGFTIGEWDKDNVLRGMKHATKYEDNWDRRKYIDMDFANKAFETIESSEFIDIAFHGLMHGYWENGENYGNPREFFRYDLPEGATERRLDYPVIPVSPEYVREHLEAWFKIYNGWGFTKPVKTFISPASLYKDESFALSYAKEIEKFGIRFWKNGWNEFKGNTRMLRSIVFLKDQADIADYSDMNIDVSTIPNHVYNEDSSVKGRTVVGCHWANYLWTDPKESINHVDEWAEYFKRQGEIFGYMLSKDVSFAASQALYQAYSKVEFIDDKCIIDISPVKALGAPELKNEFYLSVDKTAKIKNILGASYSLYESHKDFDTYKLIPENDKITVEM